MKSVLDLTSEAVQPLAMATDMKDVLDKKFVIHDIEEQDSKFGDIMFAIVSDTEDGDKSRVFVRGMKPKERLSFIKSNNGFPCEGTFVQAGRAYELN